MIQRLREAGFRETADRAHEAWCAGKSLPELFPTIEPRDRPIAQMDAELRKDFDKANDQARPDPA